MIQHKKMLQVVAGVITDAQDQILIAKRPPGKPHPGLWEFPGGKREVGETALQALRRELSEEIDICMQAAAPLVTRAYTYDDYIVNLQAWSVYAYKGTPRAMEGQVLRWVAVKELVDYEMPEANDFVMTALLQQLCGLNKP